MSSEIKPEQDVPSQTPDSAPESKASVLTLPMAIVLSAIVLGGAIIFANRDPQTQAVEPSLVAETTGPEKMKPVTDADHVRGNLNAPIVMVEYSDLECPWCKEMHKVYQQVMEEYGKTGKVAWVYRSFFYERLHQKASEEAHAAECVADLGGEQAFWQFIDNIFATTQGNDSFDLAKLPEFAEAVGVPRSDFEKCQQSGKFVAQLKATLEDGINAGVAGTPHNIIVTRSGKFYPVSGYVKYETLKTVIDDILEKEGVN